MIASQINTDGALGIKGDVNNTKDIIFSYDAANTIDEKNIIKDATDSTKATIICDFYLRTPIQAANNFYVATNKGSSDWDWKEFATNETIINGVDVSDGSTVQVDYDRKIVASDINDDTATITIPLKYNESKILGDELSYLVIQKSLNNLEVKAKNLLLETKDSPSVDVSTTKTTLGIEAKIEVINLKSNNKYYDFTIDLDGDWTASTKDQFDLVDLLFETTNGQVGLSNTEVEILVIGALILIIAILLGGYLFYKK